MHVNIAKACLHASTNIRVQAFGECCHRPLKQCLFSLLCRFRLFYVYVQYITTPRGVQTPEPCASGKIVETKRNSPVTVPDNVARQNFRCVSSKHPVLNQNR